MLGPGQTTDVLITTDQPAGRYYMAARAYASAPPIVAFDNTTTTAILEYKSITMSINKGPFKVEVQMQPSTHFSISPPAYNDDTRTATAFTTSLRSSSYLTPKVPADVDVSLFFTVGLGLNPCAPGRTCQGPNGTNFTASMNNVSFVLPSTLSILQAYYRGVNGVFTTNFPPIPLTRFDYG
ncbi:hypothetical protein IFM89_016140 [Coptis chinensis]|uniref:Plastocyanin-like domain-containing protein n=1 Tax=Coptis chinensis TaxID=261450 RepID=A0A835HF63_9MAGN|nr:hypothetical protein IFM89_016140 [Coptis chinensis]